jgi:hypothetical protein
MDEASIFLMPVSIDAAGQAAAHVPDRFRAVHFTAAIHGDPPAAFVSRLKELLGAGAAS